VEKGGVFETNWGNGAAPTSLVLIGTLEFLSGSELRDLKSGGGSLWSTGATTPPPAEGSYIFHAGAKAYNGASPAGPTVGGQDDTALIKLSSGTPR
jgi:hypothetical protein